MLNYDYIPIFCHSCGTIIDGCVNGQRLQYKHHQKEVLVGEREISCPICLGLSLSFAEYLSDEEILGLENELAFSRVCVRLGKDDLIKKRNVQTR